jgi:predicted SprT family Zn-dependent metalloprotease
MDYAFAVARKEMDKHGLQGWMLGRLSGRKTRTLGTCYPSRRRIELNEKFATSGLDSEVMDTIRHEIAHALAFLRYNYVGHGEIWQRVCREIGARPYPKKELDGSTKQAMYKYTATCNCPGQVHGRGRAPRGTRICNRCRAVVIFRQNY